jgi:hypothetical protein
MQNDPLDSTEPLARALAGAPPAARLAAFPGRAV